VLALPDSGGAGTKKKGLIGGAHMSVREEREGAIARLHKPEEKAPFCECAKASQADWAEWRRQRPGGS
jgi:hypothetical protein